jgi:hypothetical protein
MNTVSLRWWLSLKGVVLMKVSANSLERRSLLSVAEVLGLMISFDSLIATIIFCTLTAGKNDKKHIKISYVS